jgi:hypothetical protein
LWSTTLGAKHAARKLYSTQRKSDGTQADVDVSFFVLVVELSVDELDELELFSFGVDFLA